MDRVPAVTGGLPFRVFAPLVAALLLAAPVAQAAAVPRGALLSVRLTTPVSSRSSRPGDPVEAVLIAPVRAGDEVVLPAGGRLHGRVLARRSGFYRRAALRLHFDEMVAADGRHLAIDAQVVEVDNAREQVAPDGTIRGRGAFTHPSTVHLALLAAASAHPVTLALLELGRFAKEKIQRGAVEYRPGVELELALERPVADPQESLDGLEPPPIEGAAFPDRPQPTPVPIAVNALPLLTVAPKSGRTSDLTNVLLVGTRAEVESAFVAAGWVRAGEMHPGAAVHAILALAGHRRYDRAPVSRMEIDGRPPDLVFEKQCNTLAKRHHVRLWGGFAGPGGREAWLGAATHDVAIAYSHTEHTLTHRIDPLIDRERTKLVDDLSFAGRVADAELLERPRAPRVFTVAAGESVETDGRIAVVLLETEPGPTAKVAANLPPDAFAR